MIKRRFSYFVSYQIHNDGSITQCHGFYTTNCKITDHPSFEKLRQLIIKDCNENNIECKKVIFTSLTLLSTKWVWK